MQDQIVEQSRGTSYFSKIKVNYDETQVKENEFDSIKSEINDISSEQDSEMIGCLAVYEDQIILLTWQVWFYIYFILTCLDRT